MTPPAGRIPLSAESAPTSGYGPNRDEVSRALPAAAALLHSPGPFLLTTHVSPDGDAIGSVLALAIFLRGRGATVEVVLHDPAPENCSFLPGYNWITNHLTEPPPPVAIVCDAAGLDRIGSVEKTVRMARQVLEIDHHCIARPFGAVRLVDEQSFATAELVYLLLKQAGANITPEMATCLMAGLVTDTGVFRFTNVNARAFALAAVLMEAGANLMRVIDQVYDQKSTASLRLAGIAFSGFHADHGFAYASLTDRDFELAGATGEDAEGLVNFLRSLRGIQVAALLRAYDSGDVRVSLRGRPGCDVARIAARFGGGGHTAAAGCTIRGTLADAERQLAAAVDEALRGCAPNEVPS